MVEWTLFSKWQDDGQLGPVDGNMMDPDPDGIKCSPHSLNVCHKAWIVIQDQNCFQVSTVNRLS